MQDLAQKTYETLDFCAETGGSRDPDNGESPAKQGTTPAARRRKFFQLFDIAANLPCQAELGGGKEATPAADRCSEI
jgi:hypothetical protein